MAVRSNSKAWTSPRLFARALVITVTLLFPLRGVLANHMQAKVVRVAKLDIDPAQLDAYKAALQEEIETSVRLEPGVLGLFAVAEKENSAQITILELYADKDAYNAHLQTT